MSLAARLNTCLLRYFNGHDDALSEIPAKNLHPLYLAGYEEANLSLLEQTLTQNYEAHQAASPKELFFS